MAKAIKGRSSLYILAAALVTAGCSSGAGNPFGGVDQVGATPDYATSSIPEAPSAPVEAGVAVWDGDISTPGLTAAHPTMPIGSWARVTNTRSGQAAIVQVTRRLPAGRGHDVEVSRDAAAAIGALHEQIAEVLIQPIDPLSARPEERAWTGQDVVAPTVERARLPQAPAVPAPAPIPAPVPAPTAAAGGVVYDPSISTNSIGPIPSTRSVGAPRSVVSGVAPDGLAARYVQFGSFRDPSNAQRLVSRLNAEGMTTGAYGQAFVETAQVDGVIYHRVRLGPISGQDQARRALRDARAYGHNGARVLRR